MIKGKRERVVGSAPGRAHRMSWQIMRSVGGLCLAGVVWLTGCAEGAIGAPPVVTCTLDADCDGEARCDIIAGVCRIPQGADMGPQMDMTRVEPDLTTMLDMPEGEDLKVILVPDFGSGDMPANDLGRPDQGGPVDMAPVDMAPVDMAPVDMAIDRCLDVTCAPKGNICQGDSLVSYAGGVCSEGVCDYDETRTDCVAMGNRKCESGACVDRVCDPGCEAPGTCNQGSCVFPTCVAEGDACDPSPTEQGSFLCLIDDATTQAAHCYSTCPRTGSGQGCNLGQRCFAPVTNNPNLLICLDSDCASNADCGNGTCVKFENSFGICEPGGAAAPGGNCNPGNDLWCQQGSVCAVPNGATQGVCERTCEPWTGAGCGASEYCALYTNRMGTCTSDQDPTGTAVYEQCTMPGNYCDDATPCFSNGGSNVCFKYCRPNSSDCAGIDPSVTCDNYIFAGDRSYGICNVAACTVSSDCQNTSDDCLGGLCRTRCTQGTVVSACGSAEWSCVAGYCE